MIKRSRFAPLALSLVFLGGFSLLAAPGCKKDEATKPPTEEEEKLAASPGAGRSVSDDEEGDPLGDDDGSNFDGVSDEDPDAAANTDEKLKRPEPVEKCKGKGKKKTCEMVDPDPKLSAQIGVNAITKGYSWGMTTDQVLDQLAKKVEAEYNARQKKAKDPMAQDANREWRKEQLAELRRGNVKFRANSNHKWGVSLIQFEFEDDNGEEMVWLRTGRYLRTFYFFKDNGLWKIVYAYQTEKWGDKEYEEVVETSFKKWFGINPEAKVKQDPKTAAPLVRYNEWTSKNGDRVRSFNLSAVHGVYMVTVLDGNIEDSIGERLPNIKDEEEFSSDVADVLGGSDVQYDENGNIITGVSGAGGDD